MILRFVQRGDDVITSAWSAARAERGLLKVSYLVHDPWHRSGAGAPAIGYCHMRLTLDELQSRIAEAVKVCDLRDVEVPF